MLTESDIDHLIYIVGESKKKCLDDGHSGHVIKLGNDPEEDMRYSVCSQLYTKLNVMKNAYDTYEKRRGE